MDNFFDTAKKSIAHKSPILDKVKGIDLDNDNSEDRIIGFSESSLYNSKEVLCFNFYKHITRVIDKYDF